MVSDNQWPLWRPRLSGTVFVRTKIEVPVPTQGGYKIWGIIKNSFKKKNDWWSTICVRI